MKPDLPLVLGEFAHLIQGELSAQLMTTYAGQQVLRASVLMPSFAIEFDRAAARRVEENAAMRTLFAQAAPCVTDPELRQALTDASVTSDNDLHLTALQHGNALLRDLLIRLQVWAEGADGPEASCLNEAIWRELKRSTERRALPVDRV